MAPRDESRAFSKATASLSVGMNPRRATAAEVWPQHGQLPPTLDALRGQEQRSATSSGALHVYGPEWVGCGAGARTLGKDNRVLLSQEVKNELVKYSSRRRMLVWRNGAGLVLERQRIPKSDK